MTTAADDRAAERAFEASLAGRPAAGEAASLAAFTEAVRGVAVRPGRPHAALAELLATGLITDLPSPSARTATSTGSAPSRAARFRRRSTMILPVLIAKFLSAGAVAQAATGAGVAVVLVSGAGAVGVLPDPVQTTFSSVTGVGSDDPAPVEEAPVEEVPVDEVPVDEVPVEPAPEAPADVVTEPVVDEVPEAPEPVEPVEPVEPAEPVEVEDEDEPFGRSVSEDARDGGVDGREISERAKERNEQRKAAKAAEREAGKQKDKGGDEDGDDEGDDEGDDD